MWLAKLSRAQLEANDFGRRGYLDTLPQMQPEEHSTALALGLIAAHVEDCLNFVVTMIILRGT